MRHIVKEATPDCLQKFIDDELGIDPEPANLTYRSFGNKKELLKCLTDEQFGLCAYTGVNLDSDSIENLNQTDKRTIKYKNHIEHLKSQHHCKQELKEQGLEYGRVLGDDLAYNNMVAALETNGAKREQFGAKIKENKVLPISPLDPQCEDVFKFLEADGGIEGRTDAARDSIEVLKLDHKTLTEKRLDAISAWLDPEIIVTPDDFHHVIQKIITPVEGKLPAFSFVIKSIAEEYLA